MSALPALAPGLISVIHALLKLNPQDNAPKQTGDIRAQSKLCLKIGKLSWCFCPRALTCGATVCACVCLVCRVKFFDGPVVVPALTQLFDRAKDVCSPIS